MPGGLFGRSLCCLGRSPPTVSGETPREQVGATDPERVIPACFGMFGYTSAPVTTTQYLTERAEHQYRKRASNLHRPRVVVRDRIVGVGNTQAPGRVGPLG